MSSLDKIAFFQNRRDELPNQRLAQELAATKDDDGIREIAANLQNKNRNVRSDCLKVLYEIGYLDPGLVAGYCNEFLALLKSRDNRMVWGALIGLATIADLRPDEIWEQIDEVILRTGTGTVISQVWGLRVLAHVAAANQRYRQKIFPFLLEQIRGCLARDIPTHAGSILCAVDKDNKGELVSILEARQSEMTPSQLSHLKKVRKQIEAA